MRSFTVAAALILLSSAFANADTRNEAITVISSLRDAGINLKMPDDMQSIDATFLVAEKHYQLNNPKKAEQYYLLTIQKARLLVTSLLSRTKDSSVTAEKDPLPDHQQSTADSASTDQAAVPADTQPDSPANVQPPIAHNDETAPPIISTQPASEDNPEDLDYDATAENIIGSINTYIVQKNDSLGLVAAKLGVSRNHLVQVNRLDTQTFLKIGQKLRYNNRKIVPQRIKNGIIINIPDRTLYYFRKGKLAASMPVALGTTRKNGKYDWKTPTGKFKVTAKQKDPTWYVPLSIQSEMADDGKEKLTRVPPGPKNPLGKYAIKTSLPGILIHSTTKPGSIYSYASHGCIRANQEHLEGLFNDIKVNMSGEIIYRPVKLAVTNDGRIFLEVHQDVYGKNVELAAEARRLIEKENLSGRVDWAKVNSMIKLKAGIAKDVTL